MKELMMKFFSFGAFGALVIGLSAVAVASSSPATAALMPSSHGAGNAYAELPQSDRPTSDAITGHFVSPRMSIEIVLTPRDEAGLGALLHATYDPHGPRYHDWLRKGEFDALFAPENTQIDAVARFLTRGGLTPQRTSSPFLVRAIGPSAEIESLLNTRIATYRDASGRPYYANAEPIRMPAAIAKGVYGVIGLTDTTHVNPQYKLPATQPPSYHGLSPDTGCEYPYPTTKQIFLRGSKGTPFPFGYGAGPSCLGLTQPQINSLYGAPSGGASEQGSGVNVAVFELSAYTESDITTWFRYYFGSSATPPLTDVLVDC
jgi:subtilase family serine protease